MAIRTRIAQILLWYNVISMGIWAGGTVYQMVVIVPLWSAAPPESVRAFFLGTGWLGTIGNFFGPRTMALRMLPILLGVVAGWHLRMHRGWLLVPALCSIAGVAMTLSYIYPINDVLFTQAGGNLGPEAVRGMVRQWIVADRVRFAIMSVGYLCLLRALSIPFPNEARSTPPLA